MRNFTPHLLLGPPHLSSGAHNLLPSGPSLSLLSFPDHARGRDEVDPSSGSDLSDTRGPFREQDPAIHPSKGSAPLTPTERCPGTSAGELDPLTWDETEPF